MGPCVKIVGRSPEGGSLSRPDRIDATFEHMLSAYARHRIILDDEGRPMDYVFLDVNGAFETLLDLPREKVLGRRVTELLPGIAEDDFDWISAYGAIALGAPARRFEQYSSIHDRHWVVSAFSPAPEEFVTLFEDATPLRKALVEKDALIEATRAVLREDDFETTARAIFDEARRVTGATSGYVALLSESGEENEVLFLEAGGRPCTVDPELPMPIRGLRALAYERNETVMDNGFADGEWARFLPAGHVRLDNVLFAPLAIEGKVVGIMGLANKKDGFNARDLRIATAMGELAALALKNARRRELAAEAQCKELARLELEQRLERKQRVESLGVLAGGVAHDFNNLLAAILGHADLALGAPLDEAARLHLDEIVSASRRASELCRQMLAYSGHGHFLLEPVTISSLVETSRALFESLLPESVKLRIRPPAGATTVLGDRSQLHQLLVNLITNAAEAMEGRRGDIVLSWSRRHVGDEEPRRVSGGIPPSSGTFVELRLRDEGSGMDEEVRNKVFDPFFSTKFTGRGLGMAAVLGIVRGHEGAIWIDSLPDAGTTVTVLLPVAPKAEESVREPRPLSPPAATPSERPLVLLVDDEPRVLQVASRMMGHLGFDVVSTANGTEALERLAEMDTPPACVLMDVTMPGLDGPATLRRIRELHPDLPVLLASGYPDGEIQGRTEGLTFSAFLQKPYRLAQLREVLDAVVGRKES